MESSISHPAAQELSKNLVNTRKGLAQLFIGLIISFIGLMELINMILHRWEESRLNDAKNKTM